MSPKSPCPTERELADFTAQRLPAETGERLRQHLGQCPRCRQAMAQLQTWDEREAGLPPAGQAGGPPGIPLPLEEAETDDFVPDERPFDASLLEPSDNQDALGRLGKYEVLGILGRGGMGVVLRGTDTQLRRPVAVKLLNRALSSSDTARRRFLREARAAAAINHPHVVTIYAVEEFRGTPLIVMELVSGCTLRDRIQRAGRLPPLEVLRISTQVASGLAAAHAQGVIHRDVKPGNILIEEQLDRVKLTDFGVARAAADQVELTARGAAIGTPAYMAPEQVRGEKIDSRADLFALGCVIYAMCLGHSPFHGDNAWVIARRVSEFEPRPLHEQDPSVPEFLSDIVVRLLQKIPDERFQSAAEVAELLWRHLAQLNQTPSNEINGVLYRASKPAVPPPPPRRRIRWLAAAALVLLGAAAFGSWQLRGQRLREATPSRGPAAAPQTIMPANPTAEAAVQTISVAKQGQADARTIAEALDRARPGALIRVLDDAVYAESIGLNQGDRQAGIRLISEAGATLAPSPGGDFAVLVIKNTPRVTVRGFKIRPAAGGHGVAILGVCPGARLEACDVAAESAEHWALIFVTEKAAGSAAEPIVIQDCSVHLRSLGLVIQGEETAWAAAHVQVLKCRFSGPGQHVQLNRAVQDVALVGNVFIQGSAVICSLGVAPPASDSRLTNNTFFQNDCWLDLGQSRWQNSRLQVHNNLIVGAQRLQADAASLAEAADSWNFSHNLWEPAATSEETTIAAVARPERGLPFVSRDLAQADFLRPTAESPAATAGAGGTLPSYVGAFAPVAQ